MTALTTLRDILGRATVGKWVTHYLRHNDEQNLTIEGHPYPESIGSLQFEDDAAAIVQSISLARVVVDQQAVLKLAGQLARIDEFWDSPKNADANPGWGPHLVGPCLTLEHSGDCTKQAWTCLRCDAEMYMTKAQAVLECLASLVGEEGK